MCRHLNLREPVGFVEGYDPAEPDTELFHAWCAACDEVLEREGASFPPSTSSPLSHGQHG